MFSCRIFIIRYQHRTGYKNLSCVSYNVSMSEDILREVLASLSAQRENLPKADPLEEVYVDNYHEQLDLLDKIGIDVGRFRVPGSQIKPVEIMNLMDEDNDPPEYTPEKYVARSLLLTKIDTVLGFFNLAGKQIGFKG
jgi:hypothetical protein